MEKIFDAIIESSETLFDSNVKFNKVLKYKNYTGTIEYSKEDKCLFGHTSPFSGSIISYEGKTIKELTDDFQKAIEDYLPF